MFVKSGLDKTGALGLGQPTAIQTDPLPIHLATGDAVFGTQLTGFVAYDERLLTAAAAIGLPTAAPGR